MAEYLVDEFIDENVTCTMEEQVDKKVSLLYDLCILHKKGKYKDNREKAVRKLLTSYENEIQINNVLHDVVVGNSTLNQILKRKGYLQ